MENAQISMGNNRDRPLAAPLPELGPWREFQRGIESLLDISLSLYDSEGRLLIPSERMTSVCRAVYSTPEGHAMCDQEYRDAAERAAREGKTYIFRCHTYQYIFSIPFSTPRGVFVIMGGRAYLGDSDEAFTKGLAGFGFDETTMTRLRGEKKTMPAMAIFTLPDMVRNISEPFFRGLFAGQKEAPEERPKTDRGTRGFSGLLDVYRSISGLLDRDELYEVITAKSVELLGAERGSLMILDKGGEALTIKASRGLEKSIADNVRVRVGEGIAGLTASKGVPFVVEDIEAEVPWRKRLSSYRTGSFISVPLKLDDRVIGVLNVADKRSGQVFTDEDLLLLLSLANYATIALERGAYYNMSEKLKTISMTDPLTGLFNRRFFRERLFEEAERVKRRRENFTTFIIDVDNFKAYNDRYGHPAGDEVLKKISATIRDAVRSMDVVVRYGGEEFAVILPHTSKKDSCVIAERIRKEVERLRKRSDKFAQYPTISIGVAEFPRDARNIDDLIYRADAAMYAAKRRGKNRVVVYEK